MAEVRDLLRLPAFRKVTVIAGSEGLDRKAENVAVMEVPDIKQWLRGNDVLITSFYSVREEAQQCALIEDLADTCSCIAVKTGNYVPQISEAVKETADRVKLPLLQIPYEVPYTDLLMNAMAYIMEEENTERILEKYLNDVVFDRYSDEILMIKRGSLLGFDIKNNEYTMVNIQFAHGHEPTPQEKKQLRFFCRHLQARLTDEPLIRGSHLLNRSRYCLLVLESPKDLAIMPVLRTLLPENGSAESAGLVIGVGPKRGGLSGIRETYSLSYEAVHVGQALNPDRDLFFYDDLMIFCELGQFFTQTKNRELFTGILRSVRNEEIIETLQVYFECNESLDLTAEKLFTHKNTVKYRLRKLQEHTGLDLKNTGDRFRLYLAVLARKLRKE